MVSWFIWSLAPFVAVFLGHESGGGISLLGPFMSGFVPLLLFILCLFKKDVFWKINVLDVFCGILSLFAIVCYILTSNLVVSVLFAILSDFLAYIPTFRKTYRNPETENASVFLGGIIMNVFSLLIIKSWAFAIYAFSLYIILANLSEILLIYRKKIFKRSVSA